MDKIRPHIGMRGIAALLVVFYHDSFLQGIEPSNGLSLLVSRSYLMVDLFFILSGFIMHHVYSEISLKWQEYSNFVLRRLARIYPLHLACLFGMLAGKILLYWLYLKSGRSPDRFWIDPITWQDFSAQLILIHSLLPTEPTWNIPSWSISAELIAYLLFPFLAVALKLRERIISISFFVLIIGYYSYVGLTTGSLDVIHGGAPIRCLAGFMTGILLHKYANTLLRFLKNYSAFLQLSSLTLLVIILCHQINDPLIILPFSVIVLSTSEQRGILSCILSSRYFQFLGEISYSIYLTHVPIMMVLYPAMIFIMERVGINPMITHSIWLATFIATVLIVSTATFKFIEMPARRWITQNFTSYRTATS